MSWQLDKVIPPERIRWELIKIAFMVSLLSAGAFMAGFGVALKFYV